VLSSLILEVTQKWIRRKSMASTSNDLTRKHANNGVYHLARMAAFLWRGNDNWNKTSAELKEEIDELKANSSVLDSYLTDAITRLEGIISANAALSSDVDGALKSNLLESEISRKLHNP
jgi:hypothetical protein